MKPVFFMLVVVLLLALNAHAELAGAYVLPDGYKLNKEGTQIWSTEKFEVSALKKANHVWDGATHAVSLRGAKGECVAFQVIVEGGAEGAKEVNLKVSGLAGAGSLPARQVELYKEWYTLTKRASAAQNAPSAGVGWYPDALVPWDVADHDAYDGPPFAVEPGNVQAVWCDLTIPRDAQAGLYRGAIEIMAGGQVRATLALNLHVYAFELPREMHHVLFMNGCTPDIWEAGGYWLGKDEVLRTHFEEECYRLARRHRFVWGNMYYRSLSGRSSLQPKLKLDAAGELEDLDWTEYDARWSKVLDSQNNLFGPGEPPIEYWRLPMSTGVKDNRKFPESQKVWVRYAQLVQKHWKEKGWDLDRAYVYLVDEPRAKELDEALAFAKLLHEATTPPLHTQMAILPQQTKDFTAYANDLVKRYGGLLDRWLWSANSVNPEQLHAALPKEAWKGFYQGNEPYAGCAVLDKDGLNMRTWSWIAWRYRLDFSCYYCITSYAGEQDENKMTFKPNEIWTNPENRPNGNQSKGVFVYPGGFVKYNLPIGSLRLKQVRRGQQDYEYLWLLDRAGKRELADAGVKRIMVKALAEAAPPGQPGQSGPFWSAKPEEWDAEVRQWGEALEKR